MKIVIRKRLKKQKCNHFNKYNIKKKKKLSNYIIIKFKMIKIKITAIIIIITKKLISAMIIKKNKIKKIIKIT